MSGIHRPTKDEMKVGIDFRTTYARWQDDEGNVVLGKPYISFFAGVDQSICPAGLFRTEWHVTGHNMGRGWDRGEDVSKLYVSSNNTLQVLALDSAAFDGWWEVACRIITPIGVSEWGDYVAIKKSGRLVLYELSQPRLSELDARFVRSGQ